MEMDLIPNKKESCKSQSRVLFTFVGSYSVDVCGTAHIL